MEQNGTTKRKQPPTSPTTDRPSKQIKHAEGPPSLYIFQTCPVPAGRTTLSCRKLILRMKEKHKEDMENIKNGLPLGPAAAGGATATPEKPKATPRKRKSKIVEGADANSEDGAAEGSPKKKVTPRPRKKKGEVVEEVKSESIEDEEMI